MVASPLVSEAQKQPQQQQEHLQEELHQPYQCFMGTMTAAISILFGPILGIAASGAAAGGAVPVALVCHGPDMASRLQHIY
mmetsp:Transcript_2733/g.7082  ORF Transcript_2733/g.7082 Transcript_2733/m.7082 type:complete len:81 (+) Transcript_2733:60-302(+)